MTLRDEFSISSEIQSLGKSNVCFATKFAVWRFVAAAYLLAVFIWSMLDSGFDGDIAYFYIYLTHWTLLFQVKQNYWTQCTSLRIFNKLLHRSFKQVIYLCCAAVLTIRAASTPVVHDAVTTESNPVHPGAFATFTLYLQDLTYDASFTVVMLYWGKFSLAAIVALTVSVSWQPCTC
jgi:hypothetical protein